MPWGVCRMLFAARAEAHEAHSGGKGDGVYEATQADINGWI